MNPDGSVGVVSIARICCPDSLSENDGAIEAMSLVTAKLAIETRNVVPVGVEIGCGVPLERNLIAAVVALRFRLYDPSSSMQGLMHIPNKVEQPDKIVGFELVGLGRGQDSAEGIDLGLSVGAGDGRQRSFVWREGCIYEVPVPVAEKEYPMFWEEVGPPGRLPPSEPSSEYCDSPLMSSAQVVAIMKIIMSCSTVHTPGRICFSQLG